MKIIIDASNISSGGGLTHLSQLLKSFDKVKFSKIENITVYASEKTIKVLPKNEGILYKTNSFINKNILIRLLWQQLILPITCREYDVLFSPGSTISFLAPIPKVTISQNLLPFEHSEYSRYPLTSIRRIKMFFLRQIQALSFKKSDGIIFLTKYAQDVVNKVVNKSSTNQVVIPHGIEERFFQDKKQHRVAFSKDIPCQILYVSTIDRYKHQWNVVRAVDQCIKDGLFINLTLIGSVISSYTLLEQAISESEHVPKNSYVGLVPYDDLHKYYHNSDMFVFASTCENLPIILLEAMASNLPIVCSRYGPMPEVLKANGVYFDPLSVDELVNRIKELYNNLETRRGYAIGAYDESVKYSWKTAAEKTFNYLASWGSGK